MKNRGRTDEVIREHTHYIHTGLMTSKTQVDTEKWQEITQKEEMKSNANRKSHNTNRNMTLVCRLNKLDTYLVQK